MAPKSELGKCNGAATDNALSPFYALNYSFGMLLGADDFSTQQAYHRGKMRLHNAWLHRMGVIWGYDVKVDVGAGEVRVAPGLAVDGAGRELHLDAPACVSVGEWFEAHQSEVTATGDDKKKTFDAFVSARFRSCFTRQVPALLDPCEGAGGGTAYSRLFETVDLRLEPGAPPAPPPVANHRLRVLFGLEPAKSPDDDAVTAERDRIAALAAADQPPAYLAALRRFAALDSVDSGPASAAAGKQEIFPVSEDTPIVLAAIPGITVELRDGKWTLTAAGAPDVTIRPALLATATIQELLCGPLLAGAGTAAASSGPRVRPATVDIADQAIAFETDRDLLPESVKAAAFSVSVLDPANGWTKIDVNPPTLAARKVTVPLKKALAADARVRFIARGTGDAPLVGTDLAPLAGAVGAPPAPDGLDFLLMRKRS